MAISVKDRIFAFILFVSGNISCISREVAGKEPSDELVEWLLKVVDRSASGNYNSMTSQCDSGMYSLLQYRRLYGIVGDSWW